MNIEKILYDDYNGIIAKLRRNDFNKDESQLELLREFARKVNAELREGKANPKEVIYIVAIVYDLLIFADAGWTIDFATEIYGLVNFKID